MRKISSTVLARIYVLLVMTRFDWWLGPGRNLTRGLLAGTAGS
jgi:hypothetical protein